MDWFHDAPDYLINGTAHDEAFVAMLMRLETKSVEIIPDLRIIPKLRFHNHLWTQFGIILGDKIVVLSGMRE